MLTNKKNQLVLIERAPNVSDPQRDANMVCVRSELAQVLELYKLRTGHSIRTLVNTMLEYALSNVEVVDAPEE